jgi:DNA topoisomerase-1
MDSTANLIETAESVGLHYISSSIPGIRRQRRGKGFSYEHPNRGVVRDAAELERIKALAIPPAYKKVWICPDPEGHLQAIGIDDRGRKQYRYHPRFREAQEETKFHRMLLFGKALPGIRARVNQDMNQRGFPRSKVVAVVVQLLERSHIRVGNEGYAKQNQSFGLTTLENQHLSVHGQSIEFHFRGKSKVWHEIEIHDRRLARIIKQIQDLPGQELFHYLDEAREPQKISSADVNAYLREASDEHFTAKDFRTWWGTVLVLMELMETQCGKLKTETKRAISAAVKQASKHLGNTPAICRKCYVHPAVIQAFEKNMLNELGSSCLKSGADPVEFVEAMLVKLLSSEATLV